MPLGSTLKNFSTSRLDWRGWLARLDRWPTWRLFLGAMVLGLLISLPWQCARYFTTDTRDALPMPAGADAAPLADAPISRPGTADSILGMPAVGTAREVDDPLPDPSEIQPANVPGPEAEMPATAAVMPGEASAAVAVFSPPPEYPGDALRSGDEGTVLVRVTIDASGMPLSLDIQQSSHSRILDRAAVEALRQWRFKPAIAQGIAVEGSLVIPISFKARHED